MDNELLVKLRLATEQFIGALNGAEGAFGKSMEGMKADAASTGQSVEASFKALGIRSVREIEAEIHKLQAAMAQLRQANMLPADAARVTQAFNARLAELRAEATGAGAATANMGANVQTATSKLGAATAKITALVASVVGLRTAINVGKEVIDTASSFQTLEMRLSSLLGSNEAAKQAFIDIKELARTTPFEVSALTEAYAKLTAFGLTPSMEQMRALADTAASVGGGTEMLSRVTLALGQAWTKGKLQGQEIMQMAEAGIPVWDLLAQATGRSVPQLQKMSEAGELGKETILKLIDAMGGMNDGASEKLMDTYAGAVSNAKDALAEFFDMVGRAGVLDWLKEKTQELLDEFDRMKESGELAEKAKQIADGFIAMAEAAETLVKVLAPVAAHIDDIIKIMAAAKLAKFASELAGLSVAGKVAAGGVATATTAVAGLTAGARAAAIAFRVLRSVTGLGLGLLAVEGLVSLAQWLFKSEDGAKKAGKELKELAKPEPGIEANARKIEQASVKLDLMAEAAKNSIKRFDELRDSGKTAAEAVAEIGSKYDVTAVDGLNQYAAAMQALASTARATADEIRNGLARELEKLTGPQLAAFGLNAQASFDQGKMSAEALALMLDSQLSAALKKVGSDAAVTADGMTAKFRDVAGSLDVIIERYDAIAEAGGNAGEALRDGLDAALRAASNPRELEHLGETIKALGEEGKLAKQEVVDMLDAIKRKADEATPGINSLAEAFKALGMKSREELQATAAKSKEAFDFIRNGGGSIREVQEAFKRYAADAIAANGGVADSFLQVQARMYGFGIETDSSGKQIVRTLDEIGAAAERAGERITEAGDAAERVKSSGGGGGGKAQQPTGTGVGWVGGSQSFNMTEDEQWNLGTDLMQRARTAKTLQEKDVLEWSARNLMRPIEQERARRTKEGLLRAAQEDTKVERPDEPRRGEIVGAPAYSGDTGRSTPMAPPMAPPERKVIRIELAGPGGETASVTVDSDAEVNRVLNVLSRSGRRAGRRY